MLHGLRDVLDKDFQNTSDIGEGVRDESQELTNYKEIKHIVKTLNEMQELVILIKKEHVSTKKKLDYLPDFAQFDHARNFFFAFNKQKSKFEQNLKLLTEFIDSFDPQSINWLYFFEMKELHDIT